MTHSLEGHRVIIKKYPFSALTVMAALTALTSLGALVVAPSSGWALGTSGTLGITRFSPQGEVAQVRQVVVQFDSAAIRFGDAQAAAPLTLSCSDAQASKGQGRWLNERQWVFDFAADLPPGVSCTARPHPTFKAVSGAEISATKGYKFNTGGPFVLNVHPGTYENIDEEQYFIVQLNGPATTASVQQNLWCELDGVGERVPVRLIEGAERKTLLKQQGLEPRAAALQQWHVMACNRRMTSGTRMQLVYGKGVATPSGIANTIEKRFSYDVRPAFSAEFSCERSNAQSGCLPIRPMRLSFNAPVPRQRAQAIRLQGGGQTWLPKMDDDGAADSADKDDLLVSSVRFEPPLSERSTLELSLPAEFQDASGRSLSNASSFPLRVATGDMPPLAKFAAAPFGIIERFAEGPPATHPPALLPVTLRNVEAQLSVQALQPGTVQTLQAQNDADIVAWLHRIERYEQYHIERSQARRDSKTPLPKVLGSDDRDTVQTRMLSLLGGKKGVQTLTLPQPSNPGPRPFEVVGIPLPVGFHVVEIASPLLGQALLDERYPAAARTMYVRTSALVTNLAVHFKLGRENASAWVTTLDRGQPVAGANVRVSDCNGRELAQAQTDAQGLAAFEGLSPEPPTCPGEDTWRSAYFISARAHNEGVQDMAFTWSDWQRGIEPWRFNVPTNHSAEPDHIAHTIFDRTLLRAGETVSMKHLLRRQTHQGFALPTAAQTPTTLVITHVGSGQQYTQPLRWRSTATGGVSAQSEFSLPVAAKLGQYSVELRMADDTAHASGSFRVEEFRLPVLQGSIVPVQKTPLIRPRSVATQVQVQYVAGGGASQLPVRVSALVREQALHYPQYDEFRFDAPRATGNASSDPTEADTQSEDAAQGASSSDSRVIADKLPLTLDKTGAAQLTLTEVPIARQAQQLVLEASYADPNGEVQTLSSSHTLWPAAVVAGIKTEGWASTPHRVRWQALALSPEGKPLANVPIAVQAIAHTTTTTRKRMVGGFYSYDNQRQTKDLGAVCTGQSDSRGLLLCEAKIDHPGEVELVVTARDKDGNPSQAATSVWLTGQGDVWFGGQDHDRIDLLPEKKNYQPGDTAVFQVRMPFRYATALVSVEREGILEQQVVQLNGQDPTLKLKVQPHWGPNVYISVLALRGRLREVPWYSFFTWGYQAPRSWWHAFWYEGKEYIAPTALVDLSKPAYRLGVAEIRVGAQGHKIGVQVKADQENYPVRGKAQVTITATLPDGKPAAGAEVAVAVVDQALLELMPNASWNVLDAMWAQRSWGVSTSTAQMQIVGRRHYGKKATPAGGGGGRAPTRELFDTLLLWKPAVRLDSQGQAKIEVPLNDALSSFQIVAVADASVGLFGTGRSTIRTTQDLQIVSGLPPLVRGGDVFQAKVTLRNTTAKAMKVQITPRASLIETQLNAQTVEIAPGASQEVGWSITVPEALGQTRAQELLWEIQAQDSTSGARDGIKISQRVIPAVPLTVQQATLVQLAASQPWTLPVAPPAEALPQRGGLRLALQAKLGENLPGVRDWWERYPFGCLEQKTSKAIGLRDVKLWQAVATQLPTYLDEDGLAYYFAPRDGQAHQGSDTLTAYLLAVTHEAAQINPAFALPDAARATMEQGLTRFVQGRIQREFWSPRKDLDMRKLTAIEALSRYGKAQGAMLESITLAPNQWPTHAVIDWFNILRRVQDVPERAQKLAQAQQILQSRLSYQGTKLIFSTEQDDYWWWLMQSGDVNTARLLLAVLQEPAWNDDIGRLVNGFIARQQGGAWRTTTANLWGGLALDRLDALRQAVPVAGVTRAQMGTQQGQVDWAAVTRPAPSVKAPSAKARSSSLPMTPDPRKHSEMFLAWGTGTGAETLTVTHQGAGQPWVTLQSLAAVPLTAPLSAGFSLRKTIAPVEQADKNLPPGHYSRGDVLRITLEVSSQADMTWVAITDPIAAGASILGSGLGRDSAIAIQGQQRSTGVGWPAFEERSFEAFRSYYAFLPKGNVTMQYTVRLNNAGRFQLPPSRVEALYAPEMFGALPNASIQVH